MSDRVPPHDLDAEQSVLGAMMLSTDVVGDVSERVRPEDFYRRAHRLIFEAVMTLYARGEPVDVVATRNELQQSGKLEEAGGALGIQELAMAVPTAASAGHYARIVADAAIRRRVLSAATDVIDLAYADGPAGAMVERAEGLIYAAARRQDAASGAMIGDLAVDALDELNNPEPPSVVTGFRDLDEKLRGGLRPGQFVVIAGRPGAGKSALVAGIARNAALGVGHRSIAMFSLEMSGLEFGMRLLCSEARVPYERFRLHASDRDRDALLRAAEVLGQLKLWIDDRGEVTIVDIRAQARRRRAAHGLDLVVVDYLQLMSPATRAENRQQEVAEISRGLKLLAKELAIPVIALSQLNRDIEKRKGGRPQLSDLRESGSLEQDPDVVILIARDDAEGERGKATLHVAKQRNGPTGTVTLTWIPDLTRFENYAPVGQGRMA